MGLPLACEKLALKEKTLHLIGRNQIWVWVMAKSSKYHVKRESRRRLLSLGETELWQNVTAEVDALPGRTVEADPDAPATDPVATRSFPDRALRPLRRQIEQAQSNAPVLDHGAAAGVDRKTMDRLRKGKLPLEGRLDLHGMTQEQAHRALVRFIERGYHEGRRHVQIITGKGTRLSGEIGVLRQKVPQWLNQPELRAKVIAFTYAPKNQGGEGALNVLLKRWR